MEWIYKVKELIQGIPQIVILLTIILLGLYVFWRGCAESRKNRSSVFDIFLVSGSLAVLIGRIVHIILEWEVYSSFIWYWLPYEKYGNKVYLFRLLPWRFLSIWDGGVIILASYLTMLLVMTFFSLVIKRWRWKHMFFPMYFAPTTMLGASFIYIGINSGFNDWIYKGLVLVSTLLIFFLLFKFIDRIVKNSSIEKYMLGYMGIAIVILSSGYIAYIYLISRLSFLENILVGIFVIWTFVMSGAFWADLKKAKVKIERVSTVRSVTSK